MTRRSGCVPETMVIRMRELRNGRMTLNAIAAETGYCRATAHHYTRGCHPSEQPGYVQPPRGQRRARP